MIHELTLHHPDTMRGIHPALTAAAEISRLFPDLPATELSIRHSGIIINLHGAAATRHQELIEALGLELDGPAITVSRRDPSVGWVEACGVFAEMPVRLYAFVAAEAVAA